MIFEIFVSVLFMVYGVALAAFPRRFAVLVLHYYLFGNLAAGMVTWFRRAVGVLFIAVGISVVTFTFFGWPPLARR